MNRKAVILVILVLFITMALSLSTNARNAPELFKGKDIKESFSTVAPDMCIVNHRVGQIVLSVKNDGTFGIMDGSDNADCLTGDALYACEYPKDSRSQYLFGAAFWIGAVVGRDTLVSEGADGWDRAGNEFNPDAPPFGGIIHRSIKFPENPELFDGAVSEEDYIAVYADTLTDGVSNDASGRPHIPLFIEVTQKTYAWSYPYAEDFILFDYEIKNIGYQRLNNTYMGVYVDADVQALGGSTGHTDDICGYIDTMHTTFLNCNFVDTVNIAWIADDDGDPNMEGNYSGNSVRNVTATRIIRTPADELDVSFNWWVSNGNAALDFGPRERAGVGRWKEDFRTFGSSTLGTPDTDGDKYYQLRNQEFDYDQVFISQISPTDTLWMFPPPDLAGDLADGYDTRYLLSFGPFDIDPGEILPLSLAYIGGRNIHNDPSNVDNLVNEQPYEYYKNLDFSDLGENSIWASRVYDNPGVDTDGDMFFGKFRYCCLDSTYLDTVTVYDTINDTTIVPRLDSIWDYEFCDTLFYEGDGVPDFKGASPPPAPKFWVTPDVGSAHIRFNGTLSENTIDVFSRVIDFEGYRVYIGRDGRESSFSIYASFDKENYNKYVYNSRRIPSAGFELKDDPFTIDQLQCLYGDSCNDPIFDPLAYSRSNPYVMTNFPESLFYFEPQDNNVSDLGVSTMITKRFPDEPYPSSIIPDSAQPYELTDDGYLKYFEYELTITDLLPTVQWWVNVTAFDFGSPASGLPALETPRSTGATSFYAINSIDEITNGDYDVYVWPNPYRFDGNYRNLGFEGRMEPDLPNDRVREVHFANLPAVCTIKIYSIDGDLIREIDHNKDISDPEAPHETWNLITRNTQLTVSGLYYWVVETPNGKTQIGKLVIIM